MTQRLTPTTKTQTDLPINGFDVETSGSENEFYLGSVVGDGSIRGAPEVYHDRGEMLSELLSGRFRSGYIYAHNLEFDLLSLLQNGGYEWLENNGYDIEIFHNGSSIIHAKIRDQSEHTWEFRDSQNVAMHMSVEDMGNIISLPKLGTESNPLADGLVIDFEAMDSADIPADQLQAYNVRDSKIAYRFVKWLRSQVHDLGGTLEITAAKTAMDLFRQAHLNTQIGQPTIDILKKTYNGYYGGRVSPLVKGRTTGGVYEYDVASLYPYCMQKATLPEPGGLQYDAGNGKYLEPTQRKRIWETEGMAKVTVKSPESQHIPVLPTKWEDKLLFPTGELTEWWTHNELRFALERGYELLEYDEGVFTTHTFNPFSEYVQTLFDKRLEFRAEDNPTEYVVKLMMNSLYGKFGQKLEMDNGGIYQRQKDATTEDIVGSRCVGNWFVESLEYDEEEENGLPAFINPIIASYVTARGRMELYKWFEYAQKQGAEVLYCDTDSIWIDQPLEGVDEEKRLGELDYEGRYEDLYVFGPKMYVADSEEKTKKTMKGIPHGEMNNLWDNIQEGTARVDYQKIASMRQGFRASEYDPLSVIDQHKTVSLTDESKRTHTTPPTHADMLNTQVHTKPFDLNNLQRELSKEQAQIARRRRERERSIPLGAQVEDDKAHRDSSLSAAENRQALWANRKDQAKDRQR